MNAELVKIAIELLESVREAVADNCEDSEAAAFSAAIKMLKLAIKDEKEEKK